MNNLFHFDVVLCGLNGVQFRGDLTLLAACPPVQHNIQRDLADVICKLHYGRWQGNHRHDLLSFSGRVKFAPLIHMLI